MGKIYGVKVGFKPGIYYSWPECEAQVKGYAGAQYKSFPEQDIERAQEFVYGKSTSYNLATSENTVQQNISSLAKIDFYVDGSFNTTLMKASYGVVVVKNGVELFRDRGVTFDEPSDSRQVVGEIRGAMRAIELAITNNWTSINIHYDYQGIESWAKGEWKANLPLTKEYRDFMQKWMKKINVRFVKVAAHTGVEFNELADKTAKSAFSMCLDE